MIRSLRAAWIKFTRESPAKCNCPGGRKLQSSQGEIFHVWKMSGPVPILRGVHDNVNSACRSRFSWGHCCGVKRTPAHSAQATCRGVTSP